MRRPAYLILCIVMVAVPAVLVAQESQPDVGRFAPSLEEHVWLLVKGPSESTFHSDSPAPRVPEELYRVNVSTNIGGYLAYPLVEDGKVFLADGGGVYSLDLETGKLLWGVEIYFDDLHSRKIGWPQPWYLWRALGLYRLVVSYGLGKAVYVATDAGEAGAKLLALDKDSGDLLWVANVSGNTYSNMVVTGGRIYFGTIEGYLHCFSEEGRHLWTANLGEGGVRGLAYGEGTLYASLETGVKLYAVDATTGSVKWTYSHDAGVGTPMYLDGMVVFTDGVGRVVAVSAEGSLLWEAGVGAGSTAWSDSYLAAGDGVIYASRMLGEERGLVSLTVEGAEAGSYALHGDELPCQPVAAGPLVFLPARNDTHGIIHVLWKGKVELHTLTMAGEEVFCPTVSVARGEVFAVFSWDRVLQVFKRMGDREAPTIISVSQPGTVPAGRELKVNATIRDARSAVYKVILAYRVNQGPWSFTEMTPIRRYIAEPTGGYGFTEEAYTGSIPGQNPGATIDYVVVAIDNVGNTAYSETLHATVVQEETTTTTTTTMPPAKTTTTTTPPTETTTSPQETRTSPAEAGREGAPTLLLAGLVAVIILAAALLARSHLGAPR